MAEKAAADYPTASPVPNLADVEAVEEWLIDALQAVHSNECEKARPREPWGRLSSYDILLIANGLAARLANDDYR